MPLIRQEQWRTETAGKAKQLCPPGKKTTRADYRLKLDLLLNFNMPIIHQCIVRIANNLEKQPDKMPVGQVILDLPASQRQIKTKNTSAPFASLR
jgi:hypothetical protein